VLPVCRPRLFSNLRQYNSDPWRCCRHHVAPAPISDDVIRQRFAVPVVHLVVINNDVHADDAVRETGRNDGIRSLSSTNERLSHRHLLDSQNNSTETRRWRVVVETHWNRKFTTGSRHYDSVTSPNTRAVIIHAVYFVEILAVADSRSI